MSDRGMWNITMAYKNKEDKVAYDLEYRQRPDVKERVYNYHRTPEYRAKTRKRNLNPERIEKKKWHTIMAKYGLCKEDFESMLDGQENKCAICKFEFHDEKQSTRPHIDHCHDSGDVRGLLCVNCNNGLGQFKDNPSFLSSAIEYLQ